MANAVVDTPLSKQTASLRSRLAALRLQIAVWFWVDGLSRILWLLLGLFGLDLAIDWFFRMDRPQRGVMLALMLAAVAIAAFRLLYRPLSATMSDDALALQVEGANKGLGQSVISALQLSEIVDAEARGMSPLLVRRTVAAGAEAAAAVDFTNVLNGKRYLQNFGLLALAFLALAGLAVGVFATGPLGIWANRNLLLGNRQWPQKTYLVIERAENGRVVFPRGEDSTQIVSVKPESEVVPAAIYLDFRASQRRDAQQMKKNEAGSFEAVFTSVLEPFEFRARGGDAVTDWVQVELVEQPALEDLQLQVVPPAYTGEKQQALPAGKGPYSLLKGSRFSLTGTANKSLRRAALVLDKQSWPLTLKSPTTIAGELPPESLLAGQYIVELEDEQGLTSRRATSFGLRIRTDREPRVRVRLIGVSGMVAPKSRIPMNVRVTDDYGVTSVGIDYRWRGDDAERAAGEGQVAFQDVDRLYGPPEFALEQAIELGPLDIPPGSGLTFTVNASDNDNVSGPNIGKSSDFLLRVVTEEELRTDMLRREKEQRQEFERLLKNQEELVTDGRALEAAVRGAAGLSQEQKDLLMQAQRRQKIISGNVAAVADRLAAIVVEVDNNRLEEAEGKIQSRLKNDIINPMRTLADDDGPQAMQQLDRARRQAAEPADRDKVLGEALVRQEAMAVAMREILRHMVRSEGYQDVVNLLFELQKSQQDVHERTLKEYQERVKAILEGAEPSSAPPPASGSQPAP